VTPLLAPIILVFSIVSTVAPLKAEPNETALDKETTPMVESEKAVLMISDIDDTIKRSHVRSFMRLPLIWNGFRSRNSFAGMSELYTFWICASLPPAQRALCFRRRAINQDTARTIAYVTGAKSKLQWFSSLFLVNSRFPVGLYEGRHHGETDDFKEAAIEELVLDFPGHELVLIGDNGEMDPEVFEHVINTYSKGRQIYPYIHSLYETPIPESQNIYVTAADLGIHFLNNGWINEGQLEDVANIVYKALKVYPTHVVPAWAKIPEVDSFWPETKYELNDSLKTCLSKIKSLVKARRN
jgi:hypothetical protein